MILFYKRQKKEEAKNNTKKKFVIIVAGAVIICVISIVTFFFFTQKIEKETKKQFSDYANIFVAGINPQRIENLTNTADDLSNPSYQRVSEQLVKMEIASKSSGIRWIYTMFQKNSDIIFGPDSIPVGEYGHSMPGEIYPDPSEKMREAIVNIFNKGTNEILGPDTDEWGTWLSVLVPIKDFETGKAVGILGIDVDYNYYKLIVFRQQLLLLISSFFILILFISVSIYVLRIKRMIQKLKENEKQLAKQKDDILNVLKDVEKEKDKVESLVNDLEKFKLAVDNASDQVVITDPEGIVVYGNKAVKIITGFTPEEALGRKAGILWKMPMPLEYYQNLWDVIKNQKKVFTSEIQNKRKNGEYYIAKLSISPVLNNENKIIYFVAIEHDITKEKEIDKVKSEFVSLASHQLRTPLSSINWYTEMLLAGDAGPINEEQKKYLNEVAIGNQRMVDLVDSLLNVSRLDLGTFIIEPEILNLKEMTQSVLDELKPQIKEKKLKIEESYDEDLKEFNADKKLLRIVFQNLLSNAVKYTPNGGMIKVEVLYTPKETILLGEVIKENSVVIKISDTGMGIPEAQKNKIFSKMFRADNARETETEGTGLGLYIIKSIVDQSGGLIWFETKENEGTTFCVAFPRDGMRKKEGTKKLD